MSKEKVQLLLDSPSWQTTAMIYWSGELKKLQDFVTSNTFIPHWREFDLYWLMSGHEDTKSSPAPREMIEQCIKEWNSGRMLYYIIRPDRTSWKENTGLGYYVRLLSMLVRENMAVDGAWKVTKEAKALEGYFTEAYALVNCMRDEWKNKGKLYGYLTNPGLGLWVQEVPFNRESLMTGFKAPTPTPAKNIAFGETSTMSAPKNIAKFEENGAPPLVFSQPALQIGHTQFGSNSLQISNLTRESVDTPPQTPIGGGIQNKGMMENKDDTADPFLKSLGAELQRKKLEELRNQLTSQPKAREVATAPNGKRMAPSGKEEEQNDIKRIKSEHTSSSLHHDSSAWASSDPRVKRQQERREEVKTAETTVVRSTVPTGPRNTIARATGDSYRPGQVGEAPSPRYDNLKAGPSKPYGLSTLSSEAQEARRVRHMQEVRNGYGVSCGPMIELLKLVCPFDLKGEPCGHHQPCRMWKLCPTFDAGKACSINCPWAHVLRSCEVYARSGKCKRDLQAHPQLCAGWGHETCRREIWTRPHKYHT